MLFNSIDFALFLPIVFILYWLVINKNLRTQNILIILSSYIFYAWWDWKFLFLILFSTIIDYIIGLKIYKEKKEKKRLRLLWGSISANIGILAFFKYYNFFIENFTSAFSLFGSEISASTLNIILPVGISFYTFQTLSYTLDVYGKKIEPTKDFISFAAFVSFFPQLVAGPIERAVNLLPQFNSVRKFNHSNTINGLRQILWGFFKKIVIADNCAEYANLIFNNSADYSGSTLLLGAFFFTMQIYGDFSGYSDIAIGTARIFGFKLMKNFASPYFSRDIAEFWRRWHISLSSWFRDYLYIPLGGSKGHKWVTIRNIFMIFIVSGFWHGANWTFIFWGVLHALYFLPLLLSRKNRKHLDVVAEGKSFPSIKEILSMLFTFTLVMLAWILFRAENIVHAFNIYTEIFSITLFEIPSSFGLGNIKSITILIFLFIFTEWIGRHNNYAIEKIGLKWKKPFRYCMYYLIIFLIFWFGGNEQEFIYFQF